MTQDNTFNVFFDTEFTTLPDSNVGYLALISIGCVAQNGREFYAELSDTWQPSNCSDFSLQVVVPLLQGGDYKMLEAQCAIRLKYWIEEIDQEVVLRSDNPAIDWPWVEQLFQFFGCWPKNLRRKCGSIYWDDEAQQNRYSNALEDYWKKNEARRHHALVDAHSLQVAYSAAATGMRYMLVDLVEQCDPMAPVPKDAKDWEQSSPTGKEDE